MAWIYLSPHFDDVALSCGGLTWEQSHAGELVSIWTMCAGEPPPGELSPFARQLHDRWQAEHNATSMRRAEDANSCRRLGVSYRYFSIPDCIYRRQPQSTEFMYATEASLNGPLNSGDLLVVHNLSDELCRSLPAKASLVCPLALGAHVDHQLTRLAAEQLGHRLWYYADFPYVLRNQAELNQLGLHGWEAHIFPISDQGLLAWQEAIAAYVSQISTFWPSEVEMRKAVGDYLSETGGICLWSNSPG
jgi:LmbE family N-acetylglucosaminyl deacetylase